MKQQAEGMKPLKDRAQPIAPSEQVRRFLAGEERHRLDSGEITPSQWFEYEKAMLQRLQEGK
jgi:hypothetical protein